MNNVLKKIIQFALAVGVECGHARLTWLGTQNPLNFSVIPLLFHPRLYSILDHKSFTKRVTLNLLKFLQYLIPPFLETDIVIS